MQLACQLLTIKESLPDDGESRKLPPHLSIIKPAPDSLGLPPLHRGSLGEKKGATEAAGPSGNEMLRVTAHVPPKLAGGTPAGTPGGPAVVSIAVEVAPLHLVWDADVCLRLHRLSPRVRTCVRVFTCTRERE